MGLGAKTIEGVQVRNCSYHRSRVQKEHSSDGIQTKKFGQLEIHCMRHGAVGSGGLVVNCEDESIGS